MTICLPTCIQTVSVCWLLQVHPIKICNSKPQKPCGALEHWENDVMSDSLLCFITAAQQRNTNIFPAFARMSPFWRDFVFLLYLPAFSKAFAPQRKANSKGNSDGKCTASPWQPVSGCRDFSLHEAAAQCASVANAKEGPSPKLVPFLRETRGDGRICSCWSGGVSWGACWKGNGDGDALTAPKASLPNLCWFHQGNLSVHSVPV